jgi:hypothetical protein
MGEHDAAPGKSSSSSITHWIENSLDKLIETVGVNPEDVLAEVSKRRIPVLGTTTQERLTSLQEGDIRRLDKLARSYIRSNAQIAGAQGFVTGLGGMITMPVTVPADTVGFLVWLIRATTGTMYAYGFEGESEEGKVQLRLGLLASTGVSQLTVSGSNVLVTQLAKQVMTRPYREAVVQATVKALAARVGIQLGHKHFAKAVPVVGGVINGSVNGSLVYAFGRRAQAHYRSLLVEGVEHD